MRKVDLSPRLRDELLAWRASLDASAPESPFFPTRSGSRRDKHFAAGNHRGNFVVAVRANLESTVFVGR